MTELAPITLTPVGVIRSCFKEKFGIPRQPGLVPEAEATLELVPPYNRPEAVRGLEAFSHLWLIFAFHAIPDRPWQPTVRPPRLGGNRRLGVFATRSTFRPNPVGLSVVGLQSIDAREGQVRLHLSGVDLLDGTPILDIKPYLPYVDRIESAVGGFADTAPGAELTVEFSDAALQQCHNQTVLPPERLIALITGLVAQDPRPAYAAGQISSRVYGMRLYDFDIRWQVSGAAAQVISIVDDQTP